MGSLSMYCAPGSLGRKKVKGKIVYCELQQSDTDSVMKEAGAAGTILEIELFLDAAQIYIVPGTVVNGITGEIINKYIHKSRFPAAVIYKSEEVKILAPFIATFSSQGPNPGTDKILKPDIAAPSVDILVAYTPLNTLTGLDGGDRYSKFIIMSGTSMACPHVAGTAAYVKSFHPSWSPAVIKSPILTTAIRMRPYNSYDSGFSYGAGQVNPRRVANPGLVYDMSEQNYIQFLCREGYREASLRILAQSKSINCSAFSPAHGTDGINYPSMQLRKEMGKARVGIFRRTVTNVGPAQSIYKAIIKAPEGVEITVDPMTLSFTRVHQKVSFTMVVRASAMHDTRTLSGSLVWNSCKHVVRSPIAVYAT